MATEYWQVAAYGRGPIAGFLVKSERMLTGATRKRQKNAPKNSLVAAAARRH